MTESFDLEALVEEFRDEAREQLDRVDAALLELEREGGLDPKARGDLLRLLHTLKGNAGMLGLSPIRDFVHVLENVLKSESSEWPQALVERLFDGVAALKAAVEAAGGERQADVFRALTAARHGIEELESSSGATDAPSGAVEGAEGSEEKAPPTGDVVRIPFAKLDGLLAEVGDLMGEAAELELESRDSDHVAVHELAEALRRRADALRESVMSLRLVPLDRVVGRFHALVRRLARQQDKEARLIVEGGGTEVDKSTADALAEPLLHLVRNAIDHGIRTPAEREAVGKPRHGTIRIRTRQRGDRVRIDVEDDGVGLDLDQVRERAVDLGLIEPDEAMTDEGLVQLVFRPGFSTRADVSTLSGRGVGLDVVSQSVRELRGALSVERPEEGGTRFTLRLPLTVAIVPSLVFEAAGEVLALPTMYISRTLRIDRTERVGATEVVRAEGDLYPVADPDHLFQWPRTERGDFGVLIRQEGRGAVLRATRLVEQRDLVVKAMPEYGHWHPLVSGGSVLPGGRVILVLDPREVIQLNEEPSGGYGRVAQE